MNSLTKNKESLPNKCYIGTGDDYYLVWDEITDSVATESRLIVWEFTQVEESDNDYYIKTNINEVYYFLSYNESNVYITIHNNQNSIWNIVKDQKYDNVIYIITKDKDYLCSVYVPGRVKISPDSFSWQFEEVDEKINLRYETDKSKDGCT